MAELNEELKWESSMEEPKVLPQISKNTLFLDKTGREITQDGLKGLFKEYDVKSVRLLNNRPDLEGKAWVEFKTEE